MRALLLCLLATPVAAWEFTSQPICTLTHDGEAVAITLTYDAALPLYTITLTRAAPWEEAPRFALRFLGDRPIAIATDRQTYSADRRSLTVTDRGFGNVLDGLQFNTLAAAQNGAQEVFFETVTAADPVAAFRDCPDDALS